MIDLISARTAYELITEADIVERMKKNTVKVYKTILPKVLKLFS